MMETRFLLSERHNPHSRRRDDGGHWWGYPSRRGTVTAIVLHTAESPPSPASALNVARWQASTAAVPSSYHVLVDSDHTVRTVLDSQTAFHVRGFNSQSVGLSFATRAALWGRFPEWDEAALERGAEVARQWSALYDIPPRWITRAQALRGVRGFVRHSVMDPSRRGDPGSLFPSSRFFELVKGTSRTKRTWIEDMMAAGEAQLDDIARQLQRGAVASEKLAEAQGRLAAAQEALVAVDAAGFAARVREQYRLEPDPHSDGIQGTRVARDGLTLVGVAERLREAAAAVAEE